MAKSKSTANDVRDARIDRLERVLKSMLTLAEAYGGLSRNDCQKFLSELEKGARSEV